MSQCLHCAYYVREPEHDYGSCHGNPPSVMLMPVQAAKADQIASGGRAQGLAPATLRPMVKAMDRACSLAKENKPV